MKVMLSLPFLGEIDSVAPTPILTAPHAVLRAVAREVTPADMALIRAKLPGMFSAMYRAPGIGLAAPQVGIGLRFALVDVAPEGQRDPLVLINPEVIAESDALASREEGCLSLPNQYAEIIRPKQVRVRYRDLDNAIQEIEGDELLATCLQHEIDHLNGILFVDHLSKLKRNIIMRRLAKEQRNL